MRTIDYPRWIRPFFGLLLVLGFAGTLWAPTQFMGWGLLFQFLFLSLGFVCIYVAELENDLLADARLEIGDWHPVITGLSIHRTHHPEQASTTAALQELNRKFWRDYLQKRRQLLRQNPAIQAQKQALQPLHDIGKRWIAHVEGQLAEKALSCGTAEAAFYERLKAL